MTDGPLPSRPSYEYTRLQHRLYLQPTDDEKCSSRRLICIGAFGCGCKSCQEGPNAAVNSCEEGEYFLLCCSLGFTIWKLS
jgi:hypothetical protein